MKKRGFEIVSKYRNAGLHLPQRQTIASAATTWKIAEKFAKKHKISITEPISKLTPAQINMMMYARLLRFRL